MPGENGKLNRREFLKQSTLTTAAIASGLSAAPAYGKRRTVSGKKVIVIGIDGMDPILSERLMDAGMLPNFARLRAAGGYRRLGTSIPPQSPVAWANFITGAGPGTHGIFDFLHREPEHQCAMFHSISHTEGGLGFAVGEYVLPLLRRPRTVLGRQGTPFWDYLDEAGIPSAVYMVPSNYPPSSSKHNHHRSLSGLGAPDLLGSPGTYQHFAEDGPDESKEEYHGRHSRLVFENETGHAKLLGPPNNLLKKPQRTSIEFMVHRDKQAHAAVVEIQNRKILLKKGQWSDWVELDFTLGMPLLIPSKHVSGICRFYLQEIAPGFRLYVSPINVNPADPAVKISEPADFSAKISRRLGFYPTLGIQEAYQARNNKAFTDDEFAEQAKAVLQTRLKLLDYAFDHYDEGLLFFYFSSTDLQAHIFWWDTDKKHPVRSTAEAKKYNNRVKELYGRMDGVLGGILKRYGNKATIIVLSDHGFAHFPRCFNINTWLRENGYIRPSYCNRLFGEKSKSTAPPDWFATRVYAVGINSLYINLKGRERDGIVEPEQRDELLEELTAKLEAVRDVDGSRVIRKVYRSDRVYSGPAMKYAPDLILGYYRGYRISGLEAQGIFVNNTFTDNTGAWSADHCFDPREVPGVLFCNKPVGADGPSLIDLAPAILAEFGLSKPNTMEGSNIFAS